jgi:SAM-dependent methyltransferase
VARTPEGRGHLADLGCGTGRHALAARAAGLCVTAVDHNATAITELRRRAGADPGLTVLLQNFGSWLETAQSSFDAIVCWDAVHHLASHRALVRRALLRMIEHLRPSGFLLVTLLCDTQYGLGPTGRQLDLTRDEGVDLLREVAAPLRTRVLKWKDMATDDSIGVDLRLRDVRRTSYRSTRVVGLFQAT